MPPLLASVRAIVEGYSNSNQFPKRTTMKTISLPLALALCLAAPSFAEVIDVGGPNPDATTIADAVGLANSGDVIRVYPGQYESFTIDGKSLSVIANTPASVRVYGVVRVRNVGASDSVELSELRYGTQDLLQLVISDCQGSVRVQDCAFRNNLESYTLDYAVGVTNCSNVAMVNCSATARDFGITSNSFSVSGYGYVGQSGIIATDSSIALYDCTVDGGDGESRYSGTVWNPSYGGSGGMGVFLRGSGEFFAAGCFLQGGWPGNGDGFFGSDGACGYAVQGWQANYSVRLLNNNISGLSGACGAGVAITPGSTLTTMTGSATLLEGPAWLRDTDTLTVTVHAEVGARVGLLFSTGHDNQFTAVGGPLLVHLPGGPNYQSMLYLGRVGATGAVQTSVPMRDLPAFDHVPLHLMATSVSPQGPRYSNPVTPILLDSAW